MAATITRAYPQPALAPPEARTERPRRNILQAFILLLIGSQIALLFMDQIALLLPAAAAPRVFVRVVPFLGSLLMLVLLPRRGSRHPATGPALLALIIVAVSVLHPTTNTLLSGTASAALYLAILAPLFWVPRLQLDAAAFRRAILIFWGFHTVSAGVGVLQVYFPGQFQPSLSSAIAAQGEVYVNALQITTVTGERVFRPMGLSDAPGGAAIAGLYAVLFGIGLFLTDRRAWLKLACIGSMFLGLVSIYLSQIRLVLVVTALCVLVFGGVLAWRRDLARLSVLASVLGAVIVASFVWAVALGGESVTSRLTTLVEDDPTEVYYSNRGHFLQSTVEELLPRYPFGAGLGRHGMMNAYFGDNSDPDRASIWVEIQWTAWLLDGGVPLVLAYGAALLLAFLAAWRVARRRTSVSEDLPFWGALLLAYNVGALAWLFTSPLFSGQGGLEFWLLNAALFAAARTTARRREYPGRVSEPQLRIRTSGN